jgi:hypothetical protein
VTVWSPCLLLRSALSSRPSVGLPVAMECGNGSTRAGQCARQSVVSGQSLSARTASTGHVASRRMRTRISYQGAPGCRHGNLSLVLISTSRYGGMLLAQVCENPIGECFNAVFGSHGHSGFGCFQGLEYLKL